MKKLRLVLILTGVLINFCGCGPLDENISTGTEYKTEETVTAELTITENEEVQSDTEQENAETVTTEITITEAEEVQSDIEQENDETISVSDESADTEDPVTEDSSAQSKPNEYGFYEVINPQTTSISTASLAGIWYLADDLFAQKLTVTSGDDLFSGTWRLDYPGGGFQNGYIKFEYSENNDTKEYWFNFYENDGLLWQSFEKPDDLMFDDIYNMSGDTHFRRNIPLS